VEEMEKRIKSYDRDKPIYYNVHDEFNEQRPLVSQNEEDFGERFPKSNFYILQTSEDCLSFLWK
jgi:hypothetical protein